jgi:hypothetical protein
VPDAGRPRKADCARPERHGRAAYHIRLLFALCAVRSSLTSR